MENLNSKEQGNQREAMIAYAAGLIDGEGYIGIINTSRQGHSPRISVRMTQPQGVQLIHSLFGGPFSYYKNQKHLPLFGWCLSNRTSIAYTLETLLPHLRVKREQALAVLEFCRNHKRLVKKGGIDLLELERRQRLYVEVKRLNHFAPTTTKPRDPERGCDSLNSRETVREESEEVPPPSELH